MRSIESQMSFIQEITKLPFAEKVILYGSRARGDNQERSDIDIAVDAPHASAHDWRTIMDIVENRTTLLGVDCVRYDHLSPHNPLKLAIDREGINLFVRSSKQ